MVVTYAQVTFNTRFAVHFSFTAGSISDSRRLTPSSEGDTSMTSAIVGRRDLVAFNAAPPSYSVCGSMTGVVVEVDNLSSDSSTMAISLLAFSESMDIRGNRWKERWAGLFLWGVTGDWVTVIGWSVR